MMRHKTLAIMGSTSVGKSALTCQFVKGTFPDHYDPTMAASYKVEFMSTNNVNYDLTLDDTAGLEQQSHIPYKYIIKSHGFILVYSVTDRQSFKIIKDIFEKIKNELDGENKPFILIGNKIDLSANRRISYEEGNMLAKEMNAEFLETSAKLGNNVKEIFDLLLNVIDQHPIMKSESKSLSSQIQSNDLKTSSIGNQKDKNLKNSRQTNQSNNGKNNDKTCIIA